MRERSSYLTRLAAMVAMGLTGALLLAGGASSGAHTSVRGQAAPKIVLEGWPNEWQAAIYVATAEGRNLKRITPFGTVADPAWSRDRRKLAFDGFLSSPGKGPYVYISTADGRHRKKIASGLGPRWSPNSKTLVYSAPPKHGSLILATINVNGRGKHILNLGVSAKQPDWSPNGHTIAFVAWGGGIAQGGEIYLAGADGSNVRQLTKTGESNYDPRWSRDGKKIRFVQSRDSDSWEAFFEIAADGSGLRQVALVPNPVSGGGVRSGTSVWSADAQRVYYCNGFGRIVALNVQTHVLHTIRLKRHLTCESMDLR